MIKHSLCVFNNNNLLLRLWCKILQFIIAKHGLVIYNLSYLPYIPNMHIEMKNIRILIHYRPCKYLPFIFLPFSIYSSGSILITHKVCGIGRRRLELDWIAQKHNLGTSGSFSTTVPNISDGTNGHMMSGSRSNRSGISYIKFVDRRWCYCRCFIRGS